MTLEKTKFEYLVDRPIRIQNRPDQLPDTNYLPSTTKSLEKRSMFYSPKAMYNWITLNRESNIKK
jgi:hypothetical protein